MNFYSSKATSRRWTMTAFAYVLGTCQVNAFTVIALNQSIESHNTNSFDFEITLVLRLVHLFVVLCSKFSIMCPSKELYVFFNLTQHKVRS